ELSGGQRQAIAVARAAAWAKVAILMDEPTAALAATQTRHTTEVIRTAAAQNLGVIVISHDIPHMLEFSDRIVVMRHGRVGAELTPGEVDVSTIVNLMVGGEES
ncbi:MAG: sugar ABC transporter ATP-binding protein, partial [Rhizobiales bacterium]|nr:sugar ABC transporter ATP-binding protein [Hyphomicrobiales bacterium]